MGTVTTCMDTGGQCDGQGLHRKAHAGGRPRNLGQADTPEPLKCLTRPVTMQMACNQGLAHVLPEQDEVMIIARPQRVQEVQQCTDAVPKQTKGGARKHCACRTQRTPHSAQHAECHGETCSLGLGQFQKPHLAVIRVDSHLHVGAAGLDAHVTDDGNGGIAQALVLLVCQRLGRCNGDAVACHSEAVTSCDQEKLC